jgi:RND family efflux transporter MFP subunit
MKTKHIILGLIASSFILFSACGDDSSEQNLKNAKQVSTVNIDFKETPQIIEFSGNVAGVESAKLSTKLMGTIVSFPYEVGNKVKKGTIIAKVNSSDILAKKQQVQAGIAQAKAAQNNMAINYKRVKNLFEKGSATQKEMEDIQMAYDMAESQLKAARAMEDEIKDVLNYSDIKAPFDGYITNKFFEEGDLSAPGHPLAIIENLSSFKVIASVSASDVNKLEKGNQVKVKIDELNGLLLQGIISEINQGAHPASRQYEVQVTIDEENAKSSGLKSGMYAKIVFDGSTNQQIVIDESLLVKRGQLTGVYTVSESNTALLRWIRLGKKVGNNYEVLSGLSVGDKVITDKDVQEGQSVEVI